MVIKKVDILHREAVYLWCYFSFLCGIAAGLLIRGFYHEKFHSAANRFREYAQETEQVE